MSDVNPHSDIHLATRSGSNMLCMYACMYYSKCVIDRLIEILIHPGLMNNCLHLFHGLKNVCELTNIST